MMSILILNLTVQMYREENVYSIMGKPVFISRYSALYQILDILISQILRMNIYILKQNICYGCPIVEYIDINPKRRKMDIQDQYLDIQLCDKHLTYSILISKIFILTYFNILDSKAECSDNTTTEYIRCLYLSRVSRNES